MGNALSNEVIETMKNALRINPESAESALMDAAASMTDTELAVVAKSIIKEAAPLVLHADISRPTLLYGLLPDDDLAEIIFKAYIDTQKKAQDIVRGEQSKHKRKDIKESGIEAYMQVWNVFYASVNGYLFNDVKNSARTPKKAINALLNRDGQGVQEGKARIGEQIIATLMLHAYPTFRMQCAELFCNMESDGCLIQPIQSGTPSSMRTKPVIYDEEYSVDAPDHDEDLHDHDEDSAIETDTQWALGQIADGSMNGLDYSYFIESFDQRMMAGKVFFMSGPEEAFIAVLTLWADSLNSSDLSDQGPISIWLLLYNSFSDRLHDLLPWLTSIEKRRLTDLKALNDRDMER